ncbi:MULTISPECIES: hypothetical protein, partial [unclassified Desulfovibrio]|uniref:hypothetical protein n=1 Tax=unclassified Desulfovibrio TaxID=2593640 RepID=UPI000FBF4B92
MNNMTAWRGFQGNGWQNTVDVREFIVHNYTEYLGDDAFLADATESTKKLWAEVMELTKKERAAGGVLD